MFCSAGKPQMDVAMFSRHNGVPHFLINTPVISFKNLQKIPKKEGQDNHPGNDVNEDAPIGYSVNKYALVKKGVIRQ
jgi:hypothetical protein